MPAVRLSTKTIHEIREDQARSAWKKHPDQTSPMTVGPEEFFDSPEDIIASAACHPSVYRGKPPKTYYVIADRVIGALKMAGYSIVKRA